jgi:hypothetical protein
MFNSYCHKMGGKFMEYNVNNLLITCVRNWLVDPLPVIHINNLSRTSRRVFYHALGKINPLSTP